MSATSRRKISERLYALCLYLYPLAFRRTYGEAMRQAFRDRRNERTSATRWKPFSDTLSDFVTSVATEHWRAHCETGRARMTRAYALTALLAGTAVFQAQLRGQLDAALDGGLAAPGKALAAHAMRQRTQHAVDTAMELSQSSRAREALVGMHIARVAIWMTGDINADPPPVDSAKVARLVNAAQDDPVALQLAAALCPTQEFDCSAAPALTRLLQIDRGNAVHWMLLASALAATYPENESELVAALGQATQAPSFESAVMPLTTHWLQTYSIRPYTTPWWLAWGSHADESRREDWILPLFLSEITQPTLLGDVCGPAADTSDALQRACTRVAARWMNEADSIAQRLAFASLVYSFNPSVGSDVRDALESQEQQYRQLRWESDARFSTHAEFANAFEDEGDVAFARTMLRENHIGLFPPSDGKQD